MKSYTWNGVSGDWNDPDNWTPSDGPPTASDDATVDGSAISTITVDSSDAANSLTLSDSNATLDIDGASASLTVNSVTVKAGTLDVSSSRDGGLLALNGGTLRQTGGRVILGRGGTISGGTIAEPKFGVRLEGGTLDDITYEGNLRLAANHVGHITNGLTMQEAPGSPRGPGVLSVSAGAHLDFDGTQTLQNATIQIGTSTTFAHLGVTDAANAGNQVLTLDANTRINVAAHANIISGAAAGDGVVNDGLINVSSSGGLLAINTRTFVNNGTIEVEHSLDDLVTFETAETGVGTDIINDGTLQFAYGVSTAATLGDQNIDFAGAGLLRLFDPTDFYGEISGWANSGREVNLLGDWAFSSISHAGGTTTLTLSNGSTTHGFEFVGDFAQSNFSFHLQPNGVTSIRSA